MTTNAPKRRNQKHNRSAWAESTMVPNADPMDSGRFPATPMSPPRGRRDLPAVELSRGAAALALTPARAIAVLRGGTSIGRPGAS